MGASLGIWTSRPWSKCSNSRSHGREPRAGSAALANVLANEFWVVDCMRQFMAQKHRKPQLPCTCLAVAQQNSGAKGIKKKKWSLKILRPALFIVLHQVPRLQNSHILQKLNRIKSKDKWLSENINNRLYMSVVLFTL